MARLGMERGLSEEAVLAGAPVTMADLENPDIEVAAETESTVVRNLAGAAGPTATWGLDAGCRFHVTTFGIWGFALVSAPTVRAAVEIGLRWIDLTYALTAPYADVDVHGDLRLTFRTPPEPEAVDRFTEVFGVAPVFGAAANTVVFDPDIVDTRLPQADEHTTALAQAQCRAMLDRRHTRPDLAGQVRDLTACSPALRDRDRGARPRSGGPRTGRRCRSQRAPVPPRGSHPKRCGRGCRRR